MNYDHSKYSKIEVLVKCRLVSVIPYTEAPEKVTTHFLSLEQVWSLSSWSRNVGQAGETQPAAKRLDRSDNLSVDQNHTRRNCIRIPLQSTSKFD